MAGLQTRKKLTDVPTAKVKAKAPAPVVETKKSNGKSKVAAAPAPAPVKSKSKVVEPKVVFTKASYQEKDTELAKKFPEVKTLIARLRSYGYDNFYFQFSFTKAGVTNPKTGRIPIFVGLTEKK
jgi:hypothetical protein